MQLPLKHCPHRISHSSPAQAHEAIAELCQAGLQAFSQELGAKEIQRCNRTREM
jgi:hypothetical protein